jgi:hypothetical protein
MYSRDLYKDETFGKSGRDAIRPIMQKFEWMKKSIEAKVGSYRIKDIDTLRFDEILRLLSTLPVDAQNGLEKLIADYVDKYAMDKMSELQTPVHTDDSEEEAQPTDLSDL